MNDLCSAVEERSVPVMQNTPVWSGKRAIGGLLTSAPAEAELLHLFGERAEAAVRLAYHLTGDREAALDISQEAFVRAMEALPALEHPARATAWFNRIVVNLSRDWVRRRAFERAARADVPARPEFAADDPALDVERNEAREQVRAALLRLPPDLRETVALVCVEGLSPKDAAEALGVPSGTLRWRLHEGRRLLREAYERRG
jgi:RNA polymerase sigma-70 factor (ECF subfamily)